MCPIIQHPRSTVQLLPVSEAMRLLHRDELADGPTPESIASAREYQRRERLLVALVLDPDGVDALLTVALGGFR